MSERFKLQHINDLTDQEYMRLKKIIDNGELITLGEVVDLLNEQQATITKLEQICETKMQEIEDIKYGLKEIAYKYRKEVQFKADTDPNQAVKEVLDEQQATINKLNDENNLLQEVLSENEKMLGKDLDMLTKLRKENKKKDIEIESLNAHITNWLNETKIAKLYQNEQYKTENLEKENEQLRQQHQRVYNYFRDYLEDEMSAENFGEMWDNVKEDERWNDE